MYYDDFKTVLLNTVERYDKSQKVYACPDGKEEKLDLDVQLDYCEEAIIRTCLAEIFAVAIKHDIDLNDIDGDDEYIELLEKNPGRHILQKASYLDIIRRFKKALLYTFD